MFFLMIVFFLLSARILLATDGPRESFLKASVLFGATIAISTELLSVVRAITLFPLVAFWGSGCLALALVSRKSRFDPAGLLADLRGAGRMPWTWPLAAVLLITFLAGLLAAPNTWDAMTYHMSRVMHWIQNGSVAHYPTNITRQLYSNPWAEYAILHLQVLNFGSDLLANHVQWFSLLGCLVATSLIVAEFGFGRNAQLLASCLVVSIPVAILQANTPQNDLVCAYWSSCSVYFMLRYIRGTKEHLARDGAFVSLSFGLAFLTKGTAFFYLAPFFLWMFLHTIRTMNPRDSLRFLLVLGSGAALLGAGHLARNHLLFGNPFLDPSFAGNLVAKIFSPGAVVSNFLKQSSLHFHSPFLRWNQVLYQGMLSVHDLLRIDLNDPRLTMPGTLFDVPILSNNENDASNPIFPLLATASILHLLRSGKGRDLRIYCICLLGSYVLFSVLIKWNPWNGRLHMPIFILATAPAAIALDRLLKKPSRSVLVAMIFATCFLSLAFHRTRPLLSTPSIPEESIFRSGRISQYFVNDPSLHGPYLSALQLVKEKNYRNIGLKTGWDSFEYPLWPLSESIGMNPTFHHVGVENLSANRKSPGSESIDCIIVVDSSFSPGKETGYGDFRLVFEETPVRIYAR